MVWNVHNMILFIKVKVTIIERIRDESWFQLSNLNYGCYAFTKYVGNEFNCYLIIDIDEG